MQRSGQMKPLRKWLIRPLWAFAVGQNTGTRANPGSGLPGSIGDLREGHGSLPHQTVLLCIVTSRHARNVISRYGEVKVPMMAIGCIGQQGEVDNLACQSEWRHCLSDKLANAPHVVSISDWTTSQKLTTSFPDHRGVVMPTTTYNFSMLIVIMRSQLSRDDNRGARDRC